MLNSPITPVVVIWPSLPGFAFSVKYRLPSAPAAMSSGAPFMVRPLVNSVIVPVVVILPIAPGFALAANQMLPSGPAVIPVG